MADTTPKIQVKVVDPTTNANELAVDASGRATVVVGDALPAGANNIGDVDVLSLPAIPAGTNNIGDVDVASLPGSLAGKAEDSVAADLDAGLPVLAVRNDAAAAKTSADGDYGMLAIDSAGRVGIADLGGTLSVDDGGGAITVDGSVSVSGAVDTELPAAAALADAAANPTVPAVGGYLVGFNGTTWDRVKVANTGQLQVDVISGGGEPTPTNPTINTASSTDTAAAASANLDSAEITEAEKLWGVIVSAAVPFKVKVQAVENGVARDLSNLIFGRAGEQVVWQPPHRNFATHAGASAGVDVFRAVVTNVDSSKASDLHAAFYFST